MARPRSRQQVDYRSLIFPKGMNIEGELQLKPVESTAECAHRHRMEVRRFWVEDALVHLVAIFVLGGSTSLAPVWAFRPGAAPEDKKWAVSVLSYLLVATAGFAFGKVAKSSRA